MTAFRMPRGTCLGVLAGLCGAVLVSLGNSFGTSMMPAGPHDLFTVFRSLDTDPGPQLTTAVRVCGLIVWFAAWLSVRHLPARRLAVVLGIWLIPVVLVPPGAGDIYNYVQQGWVVLHGGDPTRIPAGSMHGPFDSWAGYWKGTTVGYPPLSLALQAFMVKLSCGQDWLALLLMRAPGLAGVVLSWFVLPRLATRIGLETDRSRWFLLLNPFVLWQGVVCGHLDMIAMSMALLAAWLLLGTPWRCALGALVLVLAVAVKPTSAVAACVVVPHLLGRLRTPASWRLRQILVLGACGFVVVAPLGIVALSSGLFPFGRDWTHPTGDPSRRSSSLYSTALELQQYLDSPAYANGLDSVRDHALAVCGGLVLLILLIVLLTHRFASANMIPASCLTLACAIGPDGRPWYLLPALACLALTTTTAGLVMAQVLMLVAFSGDSFKDSFVPVGYMGRQLWAWIVALGLTAAWFLLRPVVASPGRTIRTGAPALEPDPSRPFVPGTSHDA